MGHLEMPFLGFMYAGMMGQCCIATPPFGMRLV